MTSEDTLRPGASHDDVHARDLRTLARGSSLNLAGSLVAAVLNLVVPIVITRGLAKDDAGIFFQATALFTILVNVGSVGADTGLLRALPRAIALGKSRDVTANLRVAAGPPLLIGTALAALLAIFSNKIGALATNGAEANSADFAHAILVLSPVLPVAVIYVISVSASRGLGSVKPLVVTEKLGRGILQAGAVTAVVAIGGSTLPVLVAWLVPYVVALAVMAAWVTRSVRSVIGNIDSRAHGGNETGATDRLARAFWAFSAPRAVSRIFSVALQRVDIVLVGALRGPGDAAVYAVATRFPIVGLMFVQAIQQVMDPRISEFLALHDHRRAQALYRTTTCWLILVSWPIYLISLSFAALLLGIFGGGYTEAANVVVILCLAMLVATACGPVDSVLLMSGRSVLSLVNTGSALAAMTVIDFLLIPHYGILGAAIGWTVGIMINNVPPLWQVHHHLGMHPFSRGTSTGMALSVATFGAIPLVLATLVGQSVGSFAVSGLLAAVAFVAGAFGFRQLLELDALMSALRRSPAGLAAELERTDEG